MRGLRGQMSAMRDSGALGRLVGLCILVAGAALLVQSIPTLRAYVAYHHVRYGAGADGSVEQRLATLESIHKATPHNYQASLLASKLCWDAYLAADDESVKSWHARCMLWCERGLSTGTTTPELLSRKANLMARHDMRAAAEFWAEYVDTVFWHPENQALLCELYARAGMLEEAAGPLALIKGRPEHVAASQVFREAVRREMMR